MTKFNTIYLDMDGPIANFHLEAIRAHLRMGRQLSHIHSGEPAQLSQEVLWAKWPGNKSLQNYIDPRIPDDVHHWSPEMESFWNPIRLDPMFWVKIEPMPWLPALLRLLGQFCLELVICTHPDKHPSSYWGKRQWLIHNKLDHLPLHTTSQKHKLTHPSDLLIDDNHDNCVMWCNECDRRYDRPGAAVLFPAPWNALHNYRNIPLAYVEQTIETILSVS